MCCESILNIILNSNSRVSTGTKIVPGSFYVEYLLYPPTFCWLHICSTGRISSATCKCDTVTREQMFTQVQYSEYCPTWINIMEFDACSVDVLYHSLSSVIWQLNTEVYSDIRYQADAWSDIICILRITRYQWEEIAIQWEIFSKLYSHSVRFEVFTAVTMKNGVFWVVTPCGSCKNRRIPSISSQRTSIASCS
jgi:hypothetical protein